MKSCNICGSERFEPGPNGRLGPAGQLIRCSGCRSLERHRALRWLLCHVPANLLGWRRAIHFAPDDSLDPTWFRSYDKSTFGGELSLDLQEIDLPPASYDFVSLSSVLEFVPDDRRAFTELLRIASTSAIIHCTFTPASLDHGTESFGAPQGKFGRYHRYGNDLAARFDLKNRDVIMSVVSAVDPVTRIDVTIHFFLRRRVDADVMSESFPNMVTR